MGVVGSGGGVHAARHVPLLLLAAAVFTLHTPPRSLPKLCTIVVFTHNCLGVNRRMSASPPLPKLSPVQVPALPGAAVVDVTGCGNACCGGFLAALNAGLSWREAAAWGCLAGSVMAEHTGVPPAGDLQALVGDARSRWGALLHAAVSASDVSLAAAQPPGVAQAVHAPCRRSCTPLRWQLAPRRCAVAQRRRMGVRARLPGM